MNTRDVRLLIAGSGTAQWLLQLIRPFRFMYYWLCVSFQLQQHTDHSKAPVAERVPHE
jgi:hypothetical protein